MLMSPHVKNVKKLVEHWNLQLQEIKDMMETWKVAQQQVEYFIVVFP